LAQVSEPTLLHSFVWTFRPVVLVEGDIRVRMLAQVRGRLLGQVGEKVVDEGRLGRDMGPVLRKPPGEVPTVPVQDPGEVEFVVPRIQANVFGTGGKAPQSRLQARFQILAGEGPVLKLRTADRAAVDHEVDAGVFVDRTNDLVFDVVQGQLLVPGRGFHPSEEPVERFDVLDAGDRIGIDHAFDDKGVVRVDPVGQFVVRGGKAVRVAARADPAQAVDVGVQVGPGFFQGGIVDFSLRIHVGLQHLIEKAVGEGSGPRWSSGKSQHGESEKQ